MLTRNEIETAYAARIEPNSDKFSKPHGQEHCSAHGDQISSMGLNTGQQIRIERPREDGTTLALYTISGTHDEVSNSVFLDYENPHDVEDRFGVSDTGSFQGKINSQVVAVCLTDADAELYNEFIEPLTDDGQNKGLIVIAPHGGNIEKHTDEQADYVYEKIHSSKIVSTWICKGFNKKENGGAFNRWHITSTDINENSFPKLKTVIERGFEYAVAFHGFGGNEKSICIGGRTEDKNLKEDIKKAIEAAVFGFKIVLYMDNECPKDIKGDSENNIVNRLSKNGLQIEQSEEVRKMVDEQNFPLPLKIANAVASVIGPKLAV